MVETFGRKEDLQIEVDWLPSEGIGPTEVTRGRLRLFVGGACVWPGVDEDLGFEWTWIELAEFLAASWRWLVLESGMPLELRGGWLSQIRSELERRWNYLSLAVREVEEEDLFAFEERHDLARGLAGAVAPSAWIVREGNRCWVSTDNAAQLVDFDETERTLTDFVSAVDARMSGLTDARSKAFRESWADRLSSSADETVEIATGLDADVLGELRGGQDLVEFWELDGAASSNELLAAARKTATLPLSDINRAIEAVRSAVSKGTAELDAITYDASTELPEGPEWYPYDQGYTVANWLRARLGYDSSRRINPEQIINSWGVDIVEFELDADGVDAISTWGPRHGPTVFVNTRGLHNQSAEGRRATLAHEIAHLLLDRAGALPLVEVLGGRSSAGTEERAGAFAAQLLIPKEVAGVELAESLNPQSTVQSLRDRYAASYEIIAWQARNSSIDLPAKVRSLLRGYVSKPWRF